MSEYKPVEAEYHPLAKVLCARPDEFFGCWLMEPTRFAGVWDAVIRADILRQITTPAPEAAAGFETTTAGNNKTIAIIRAEGLLMKARTWFGTSTVQLRRDIQAAANDKAVSGILLAIDSPGGTVAGTADLAADIKAARRKKPVWAHVNDLGASAAYWLASQAFKVFANTPTALVGSIGTVMTVYDQSEAASREGVRPVVFATGPLKGAGTPGTPVSEEHRAYFQNIVDETQASFDAAVRSGRGLSADQLAAVRTGGVFLAPEAKRLGLIDGIQPLEATLSALAGAS